MKSLLHDFPMLGIRICLPFWSLHYLNSLYVCMCREAGFYSSWFWSFGHYLGYFLIWGCMSDTVCEIWLRLWLVLASFRECWRQIDQRCKTLVLLRAGFGLCQACLMQPFLPWICSTYSYFMKISFNGRHWTPASASPKYNAYCSPKLRSSASYMLPPPEFLEVLLHVSTAWEPASTSKRNCTCIFGLTSLWSPPFHNMSLKSRPLWKPQSPTPCIPSPARQMATLCSLSIPWHHGSA